MMVPSPEYDVTFFVACYNEEENIIAAIDAVPAACLEAGCTFDMVVVDDASKDASVTLIREYMTQHPDLPITLVMNQANQGLGANYAEACFYGRGKYYRLICGDAEERPESLVAALKHLGEADMILTYLHDSRARSLGRRATSRVFTGLVNLLSGHHLKYYNGLPILRRQNVMRWHSHAHGFGFQADVIVRLLDMGATYIEVPVVAKNRLGGATKAFTFRNLASVGHTFLQILIRRIAMSMYPQYTRKLNQEPQVVKTPACQGGRQEFPDDAERLSKVAG